MSSSSSTEATAGFQLQRELGRGTRAVVYEAVQLSLGRRVALKLLPADDEHGDVRYLDWPEHPCVVRLYATGPWGDGQFVAMQLMPGPTLARLLETGTLDPDRRLALLADVAAALDAAHRAGITHGGVAARNVFVGAHGHALLSDFGLASGTAEVADDRTDFAVLMRDCLGGRLPALPDLRSTEASELVRVARAALPATPPPARSGVSRWRAAIAGLGGVVAATGLAAFMLSGADDDGDPVPPPQEGAQALGSALAAGAIDSVDCNGQPPSGSSQACTVVQTRLPGRALVPAGAGAIRRWAVRGARGELALQVVRSRGDGYVSVARSRYELVPDEGLHVLPTNLAVRRGDRIGVQLAPGAAVGVRSGVAGATTARWLGQLFLEPRTIELGAGSGFDHELLLRVEYARGATPAPAGSLSGLAARSAPAGRELSSRDFEVRGQLRRVTVVRLPNVVALDLFAGERRLARLPAPDADPAGRLLNFGTLGIRSPVLRWRNPDGQTVVHEYAADARTLRARS